MRKTKLQQSAFHAVLIVCHPRHKTQKFKAVLHNPTGRKKVTHLRTFQTRECYSQPVSRFCHAVATQVAEDVAALPYSLRNLDLDSASCEACYNENFARHVYSKTCLFQDVLLIVLDYCEYDAHSTRVSMPRNTQDRFFSCVQLFPRSRESRDSFRR